MPIFALALSSILAVFYITDRDELKTEVRKWCALLLAQQCTQRR